MRLADARQARREKRYLGEGPKLVRELFRVAGALRQGHPNILISRRSPESLESQCCGSEQALSKRPWTTNIGVDIVENKPLEIWNLG